MDPSRCSALSRAMRGLGTHSLIADAWLCARFDFSRRPGIQTFQNNLMTATDRRAATLDCHHFVFVNTSHNHPPYELWISADGGFLFVKSVVLEPYLWEFELVELS